MASLALITNCPNDKGASWRSKAPLNSVRPIKLSKPATARSAIRSQTREAGGTSVTATVCVRLDEFDDTCTSSDWLEQCTGDKMDPIPRFLANLHSACRNGGNGFPRGVKRTEKATKTIRHYSVD